MGLHLPQKYASIFLVYSARRNGFGSELVEIFSKGCTDAKRNTGCTGVVCLSADPESEPEPPGKQLRRALIYSSGRQAASAH